MTETEAFAIVEAMVQEQESRLGKNLFVERSERLESDKFWAFSYNTIAFRESRDPRDGLVGNRPIIVDKNTGIVHTVPTGGMRDWLETYNRTGQPPEPRQRHTEV